MQVKTFDPVYAGKDVIAQARTGTGKTFSFAIPLIEKLQGDTQERRRGRAPKVTVLSQSASFALSYSWVIQIFNLVEKFFRFAQE